MVSEAEARVTSVAASLQAVSLEATESMASYKHGMEEVQAWMQDSKASSNARQAAINDIRADVQKVCILHCCILAGSNFRE